MTAPAIALRNVWKHYGDFAAVRDVTLDVPEGRILALLGRNGAGKTTLLRMMGGLLRPSRGEIEAGNLKSDRLQAKALVGIVGHGQWLYDDLTAQENLEFFARLYNVEGAGAKIEHWLEATGLAAFRHARLSEFSRGMRQRLAIARAFLHDPKILLLDEPWTALDDRAMALLSSLLLEAHARGYTIVVCSHQLRETLDVATDLVVIDRGRVIFSGLNTAELKASPQDFYQRIS
jgi:heme ABC exporter ATP-binding subunit CcmA